MLPKQFTWLRSKPLDYMTLFQKWNGQTTYIWIRYMEFSSIELSLLQYIGFRSFKYFWTEEHNNENIFPSNAKRIWEIGCKISDISVDSLTIGLRFKIDLDRHTRYREKIAYILLTWRNLIFRYLFPKSSLIRFDFWSRDNILNLVIVTVLERSMQWPFRVNLRRRIWVGSFHFSELWVHSLI